MYIFVYFEHRKPVNPLFWCLFLKSEDTLLVTTTLWRKISLIGEYRVGVPVHSSFVLQTKVRATRRNRAVRWAHRCPPVAANPQKPWSYEEEGGGPRAVLIGWACVPFGSSFSAMSKPKIYRYLHDAYIFALLQTQNTNIFLDFQNHILRIIVNNDIQKFDGVGM